MCNLYLGNEKNRRSVFLLFRYTALPPPLSFEKLLVGPLYFCCCIYTVCVVVARARAYRLVHLHRLCWAFKILGRRKFVVVCLSGYYILYVPLAG